MVQKKALHLDAGCDDKFCEIRTNEIIFYAMKDSEDVKLVSWMIHWKNARN